MKWFSNLFDSTDKEIGRLRRIVAQANAKVEELLEEQSERVAGIRADAGEALSVAGAGEAWQRVQAQQVAIVTAEVRRLVGEADILRAVIEQGEQTSRDLSVLLADSKQLSAMNAEKTQRPPAERRELEEEIELLIAELSEQMAVMIEAKPGLREAILHALPKAKLHPQKPAADEMVKQVEAVASFLGREVADYFS
ncbi:MAG TPA: hypothetical protein VEX13_05530, partial [Chloroflexia bacterium]|nr:hypothetical protein [Chloroflexia bacterium]